MNNENIIYLQFRSRAVDVEIRINDIPVGAAHSGETKSASIPIREYVLPGTNSMALQILVLDGADGQTSSTTEAMELLVRVAEFVEGDWLEFDGGRQHVRIQPDLSPGTELPLSNEATFELDAGPMWKWATVPVLDLDAVRGEADHLMRQMSEEFSRRDAEALLLRTEHRMREDSSAYPSIPLEMRRVDFKQMITGSRAQWKPRGFAEAGLDYRLVGGGRLIEPRDELGLPLLRTETDSPSDPLSDPNYVCLPVLIGKLDGKMIVLR